MLAQLLVWRQGAGNRVWRDNVFVGQMPFAQIFSSSAARVVQHAKACLWPSPPPTDRSTPSLEAHPPAATLIDVLDQTSDAAIVQNARASVDKLPLFAEKRLMIRHGCISSRERTRARI